MRFKHARRTPFTSVLLPLLFNRLFGWPFQAEYAEKSAVRKNLFWLRGCKWLCYNRESDEILILHYCGQNCDKISMYHSLESSFGALCLILF